VQILPSFSHQGLTCRLPMADASATALVQAWSTGDPFHLAQAMEQDAPLAIWAAEVLSAAGGDLPAARKGGMLFLAGWLCHRGKASLAGKSIDDANAEPPVRERMLEAAELAAQGRLIADIAVRLAQEDPDEIQPKHRLRLLAMLSQRQAWLAWGTAAQFVADAAFEGAMEPLPDFVRQAQAMVAGQSPAPAAWKLEPASLEARRAEYAREWLAPAFGGACWEPLADKLEDSDLLYERFDKHLEREKLESMAEFAAGAGHEINNPLAIISGRAQLLLRDEKDPERRRELAGIHAQAVRVYEMIADMMLFARPPAPRKESVDVAELLTKLAAELAPLAAERQIDLAVQQADGAGRILADRTQLEVAVRAICDNALEAIGEKGRVTLSAEAAGDVVSIAIQDTGPGITPEIRRHLFDPYFSGRQAGRGLGLGLSKAWRIVTNHGGTIDVESQAGQGATFIMRLPMPG